MCAKIAYRFWKKISTVSSVFSVFLSHYLEKKVKETGILIDKAKREKPKTVPVIDLQKMPIFIKTLVTPYKVQLVQ